MTICSGGIRSAHFVPRPRRQAIAKPPFAAVLPSQAFAKQLPSLRQAIAKPPFAEALPSQAFAKPLANLAQGNCQAFALQIAEPKHLPSLCPAFAKPLPSAKPSPSLRQTFAKPVPSISPSICQAFVKHRLGQTCCQAFATLCQAVANQKQTQFSGGGPCLYLPYLTYLPYRTLQPYLPTYLTYRSNLTYLSYLTYPT